MPQALSETGLLAIGTYTEPMPHVNGHGAGIHLLRFDPRDGTFGDGIVATGLRNPTYLAVSAAGDRLYAVCEIGAAEGPTLETYAIERDAPALRHLARTPIAGGWPCHLSLNPAAGHLYIAAYETGDVIVLRLDENGIPAGAQQVIPRDGSGPRQDRQQGPHAHCVLPAPDGRHLYLADLGTDEIALYPIGSGGIAGMPDITIAAKPGAGPRHIAFTPSGRSLLVINELSSTITLHSTAAPQTALAAISTLPDGWTSGNTCAAIRIHPSGRFVYGSNRGHDSVFLAVLDEDVGRLTPRGHWPAGGRTPRDIALTPDGRFLLAASQDDDLIRIFSVDAETGELSATERTLALANPVCLCFVPVA